MALRSLRRLVARSSRRLATRGSVEEGHVDPRARDSLDRERWGWWKPVAGPLLDEMWREIKLAGGRWWAPVSVFPSAQDILNGSEEVKRAAAILLAERQVRSGFRIGYDERQQFEGRVLGSLGSRRPKLTAEEAEYVVELATRTDRDFRYFDLLAFHLGVAERYAREHGTERIRLRLEYLLERVEAAEPQGGQAAIRGRIRALLGVRSEALDLSPIDPGDAWGARMHAELAELAVDPGAMTALLLHFTAKLGPTPTKGWERRCRELVALAPGIGRALQLMLTTSVEMREEHRQEVERAFRRMQQTGDEAELRALPNLWRLPNDTNEKLLRGAIWAASYCTEPWVVSALEPQVDVAAFHALASLDDPAATASLARLYGSIRDRGSRNQLERALQTAAGRRGTSVSALLDGAAARHDLDEDGRVTTPVGELTASIELGTDGKVRTHWMRGDRRLKGLPKEVRDSEGASVRQVERAVARLRETVAAERLRVEELLAEDRTWSWDEWRSAYVDHPVTGQLARGLLWEFDVAGRHVAAIRLGGAREDWFAASGDPVDVTGRPVRLWHPMAAVEPEVQAWRDRLLASEVAQPIKQVYREVYRLTPAEEQTESYSNRFAGHVLRYQQAYALMRARGWSTNYLGPHSEGYSGTARRSFRAAGVRAEFYHEAVEMGVTAEWCVTDQVRFVPAEDRRAANPIPLAAVPPRVFSEAMRDVDLFVSVTSIGNTPDWADRGLRQFDDYWERWAFGELSELAKVRGETLARIVPQLAIADRLTVEDRWLRVRGDLASYRIHLGSSNIQKEPSASYLCIVPERGSGAKVFLPFDREEDVGLSLVLSKAFLLAADAKITDEAILRQIRAR